MKKLIFITLIAIQTLTAGGKFKIDDFAIRLEQLTSAPNHVWVFSGYTTVNPKPLSVFGVNDFYSPPLGAKDFSLSVSIIADSLNIKDGPDYGKGDVGLLYSSGIWRPDRLTRAGTYHHIKGNRLYSFSVSSELYPLFGKAGFVQKITITNRAPLSANVECAVNLNPGELFNEPLSKWGFSIARWHTPASAETAKNIWQNDRAKMAYFEQNEKTELKPGCPAAFYCAVVTCGKEEKLPESIDYEAEINKTRAAWQNRINKYTRNIPLLETDIPGMKDFYNRSVISGLTSIWENDKYLLNPHAATSGIDGGGTCSYLWDLGGYAPKSFCLMFDTGIVKIARQFEKINLENYYAFTLDGSGIGVKYSYSPAAFTTLVSAISRLLKPEPDLYNTAKKLALNDEKTADAETGLKDYGLQHNLLEMRSAGWEHIVVSPNAERIWCLKQLAEMGRLFNEDKTVIDGWIEKTGKIKNSILKYLWDDERKWFASLYPGGFKDFVYSIQVFDVLPSGICSSGMEDAILSHLREGAFLGKYGVSSVSAEDSVHFEVVDTDWSGGGSYIGDGLQLAGELFDEGRKNLAWDILKRYFWLGQSTIYFPQEIYIDKPGAPAHKRANEMSGLTGAEAIIFGLAGVKAELNGTLYVEPQICSAGNISLKGLGIRGNTIDLELSAGKMTVIKNGTLLYSGEQKKIRIL